MREVKANALVAALHHAKERFGSVTDDAAREIAKTLGLPLAEVTAAATFFSAFNGMDDGSVNDLFLQSTQGEGRPALLMGHPRGYLGA